jgi:hypothetical protein
MIKHMIAGAATAVAAGGIVTAAVLGAATPAAAAPSTTTLRFTVTPLASHQTDARPKGDSIGDESIDVYALNAHGRRVGTIVNRCELAVPGSASSIAICSGVALIGKSTLILADTPTGSPAVDVAVLGGTGRFATARGTGHLVAGPSGITAQFDLRK